MSDLKMKLIRVLLLLLGISLIIIFISIKIYPIWYTLPGGILILSVIAFNWTLDAGGKIKNWKELVENNNSRTRENELTRNLALKKRIKNDFGDWLNYFPENRKRNSKMIIRAFNGKQYPNSNEPDRYGEYSWFAAEIKGLYHSGIEFTIGIKTIFEFEDGSWSFNKNDSIQNSNKVKVFEIGQINFSDIVDYDINGDEHYTSPHFFCKFNYKGTPFESIHFESIDDILPKYFELNNKTK